MIQPHSFRFASTLMAGALVCVNFAAVAADIEPRTAAIREIFKPFQTDQAALAPDGKHLAYEKRENDRLFLTIVDLEKNQMMELPLMNDIAAPLSGVKETIPTRITYLKWATSDRVVACVQDEVLVAVDADGRNFKRLLGAAELKYETGGTTKPEMGRRFLIDTNTGRVVSTESGRDVLYGADGEPMDQGFKVPTVVKVGDEYQVVGGPGGGARGGRGGGGRGARHKQQVRQWRSGGSDGGASPARA